MLKFINVMMDNIPKVVRLAKAVQPVAEAIRDAAKNTMDAVNAQLKLIDLSDPAKAAQESKDTSGIEDILAAGDAPVGFDDELRESTKDSKA